MLEQNTTRMMQMIGVIMAGGVIFALIFWLFMGGKNPVTGGKGGKNQNDTYHEYQNDKRDAMTILNTIAEVK